MNKVLKMDFKGQTAVLSGFVLVGMMFLVPTITQRALAVITAKATGTCGPEGQTHPCEFTLLGKILNKGVWEQEPSKSGTDVYWATRGSATLLGGGDEEGSVFYKVEGQHSAQLWFKNPWPKANECGVIPEGVGVCTASSGYDAIFKYNLRVR